MRVRQHLCIVYFGSHIGLNEFYKKGITCRYIVNIELQHKNPITETTTNKFKYMNKEVHQHYERASATCKYRADHDWTSKTTQVFTNPIREGYNCHENLTKTWKNESNYINKSIESGLLIFTFPSPAEWKLASVEKINIFREFALHPITCTRDNVIMYGQAIICVYIKL